MRITQIPIRNYKGFRDSDRVAIGRKFTILVGQNNSGKTAFLETLDTKTFQNKPHIAPEVKGNYPPVHDPVSSVTFGVVVTGEELKWQLLRTSNPTQFSFAARDLNAVETLVDQFFSSDD